MDVAKKLAKAAKSAGQPPKIELERIIQSLPKGQTGLEATVKRKKHIEVLIQQMKEDYTRLGLSEPQYQEAIQPILVIYHELISVLGKELVACSS